MRGVRIPRAWRKHGAAHFSWPPGMGKLVEGFRLDAHRGVIMNCTHQPACPPASAPDCEAAIVVASHPEQGWSLLCNGVVVFEDTGDLLPDGRVIAPHRAEGDLELLSLCGPGH
jgi:hypothetical protein